jgi:hypothetical protein
MNDTWATRKQVAELLQLFMTFIGSILHFNQSRLITDTFDVFGLAKLLSLIYHSRSIIAPAGIRYPHKNKPATSGGVKLDQTTDRDENGRCAVDALAGAAK